MRHHVLLALALALVTASCAQEEPLGSRAEPQMPTANALDHGMFRPDQVRWKEGPPSLPSGAQFAVLEGDPARSGFFAMRLKLPGGYRIPPHTHPNVERVTVISGTLHLGMGGTFDQSAGTALPAGSYTFMKPGMQHFAWTDGETIIQLATVGPWKINYVNPADDPRKK